jgi:DNA ligase-1
MDGVRAYWDGENMYSKKGTKFSLPLYFTEGLPKVILDGELFMGRGLGERLLKTLNSHEDYWSEVKYIIFDLPSSPEPYEARISELRGLPLPLHASVVQIVQCQGQQHLSELIKEVASVGNEGLMASKPNSLYSKGRTPNLLKIKVTVSVASQCLR